MRKDMTVDNLRGVADSAIEQVNDFAAALITIATFPITDPKNQDAHNLQKIAMDALNWSVVCDEVERTP